MNRYNAQHQYSPRGYSSLPVVIKNLLIINAIVFFALSILPSDDKAWIYNTLSLHFFESSLFKPWQIITSMFMHEDVGHFFFNMFALWMFGNVLENIWGAKKFLTFYLVSGIGAAIIYLLIAQFSNADLFAAYKEMLSMPMQPDTKDLYKFIKLQQAVNVPTIGASGAVFGILIAFGYLFPNTYLYFYFLFPIKTKWAVLGYIGYELTMAIIGFSGDNVAHTAHLGGAIAGFIMVYIWNKRGKNYY